MLVSEVRLLLRRLRNIILYALATVYALLCLSLWAVQDQIIYPGAYRDNNWGRTAPSGFTTLETLMETGESLTHWYRPPASDSAPVLVAFHGNLGTASYLGRRLSYGVPQEYGLAMLEYRGFGGRPGTPSEDTILHDARALLDRLAADGIGPDRILLYGVSLGTGPAVAMAAERPVRGVILLAPFSSLLDLAYGQYPWIPAWVLLRDHWRSDHRIKRVTSPVLIVHGEEDTLIPASHSAELAARAAGPVTEILLPGAGHNNLFTGEVTRKVGDFLSGLAKPGT